MTPDQTRAGYVLRLGRARTVRDTAEHQIALIVAEARSNGVPWQVIADGLDRSVQATWNRFRHLDAEAAS